jgi:hypothetical protein
VLITGEGKSNEGFRTRVVVKDEHFTSDWCPSQLASENAASKLAYTHFSTNPTETDGDV